MKYFCNFVAYTITSPIIVSEPDSCHTCILLLNSNHQRSAWCTILASVNIALKTSHSTQLPEISPKQEKSIRSAIELQSYLREHGLSWSDADLPQPELFNEHFPIRISRHYADLIDWRNQQDPLRLMMIPDPRERVPKAYELSDPIGDHDREVVPGLIHRYPDRCLLLLTSYCLVHCRFCFRREVVGKVRPVQFQRIGAYLREHTEVSEIIFSGGDPLTFPVGFLQSMVKEFSSIEHIKLWRFHSRVPAVDPEAVSPEWIAQLEKLHTQAGKQVVVVVHIDHPREITPKFVALVEQLKQAGCLLLSQTVLLKHVNADKDTLHALFRSLLNVGVKPYYLHHLDQVYGSHHFRVSIEAGKKLYQSLRGHLSGAALPEYVLDLPGGFGKVPVMWLEDAGKDRDGKQCYETITFEGHRVRYVDQAENDNLS